MHAHDAVVSKYCLLMGQTKIHLETCFLSYTEFLNKHHCKDCPLAFSGIIATLKTIRKRLKKNIDSLEDVETKCRFLHAGFYCVVKQF